MAKKGVGVDGDTLAGILGIEPENTPGNLTVKNGDNSIVPQEVITANALVINDNPISEDAEEDSKFAKAVLIEAIDGLRDIHARVEHLATTSNDPEYMALAVKTTLAKGTLSKQLVEFHSQNSKNTGAKSVTNNTQYNIGTGADALSPEQVLEQSRKLKEQEDGTT